MSAPATAQLLLHTDSSRQCLQGMQCLEVAARAPELSMYCISCRSCRYWIIQCPHIQQCAVACAGVSGKGVVELQAQLYRTQEQARLRADGLPGVQDKHARRKAGRSSTLLHPAVPCGT